jgi:hypothetical protein
MATKKESKDESFGKAPVPEEMVVTREEAAIPVVPAKEYRIVEYRKLSEDEERRVSRVKSEFDNVIGYLKVLRDSVHDSELQRMYSISITEAEAASMWAVRAITWRA